MRVAVVAWHGYGDLVMLTAPLRRYAEIHPEDDLNLFTLKRFGDTSRDLLSGLPFIKEVHPVLPDVWNDFSSYQEGIKGVLLLSKTYGASIGIEKLIPLICFRNSDEFSIHHNKMFRFAHDLDITYNKRSQFKPLLSVTEQARQEVSRFLEPHKRPYVVLHLQAGNSRKTLTNDQFPSLFKEFSGTIFEIGDNVRSLSTNHIPIGIPNMEFTKALVAMCDRIIAIDSIVMHIAFAFEKQTNAIFTMTPAIQVVPLWKDYTSFVNFICVNPECGRGLEKVRNLI